MRIKILSGITVIAFLSGSILNAKTLTEEQEEALVKSIIPGTKVEKVARGEIDGFYKAYLDNGQILYINPFKRLIFVGEIYTARGTNITANDRIKWQQELTDKKIKTLKKQELIKNAVKIVNGKGGNKYEFVIFTDPECPYCRDVESFLEENDSTIYLNFFPLAFHKHAKKWSLEILSSDDPKKAFSKIRKTNKDANITITNEAKEKLAKMKKLAAKLGVTGTPKIYVVEKNGTKVVDIIQGRDIPKISKYLKPKDNK
ncbi:DsbC family protein [Nitrosophilus labii]|uniref:DsbC family protein n=1 Tax=Nitrosophilus labii TaxID=2706014 RepID=UPI0016570882|nr:DsbC family protein [Nitrosophilus labii]